MNYLHFSQDQLVQVAKFSQGDILPCLFVYEIFIRFYGNKELKTEILTNNDV